MNLVRKEELVSQMSRRNGYIDVCKGIGIISVVIGYALNTDYFFRRE